MLTSRRQFLGHAAALAAGASMAQFPFSVPASAQDTGMEISDLVIYGGTAAGVMAAVQAARMGKSVVLLEPGRYLGGMVTGGLGATDYGNKSAVGGLALEFYQRMYRYYLAPEVWKYETRAEFAPRHPLLISEGLKAHWFVEPHVAAATMLAMIEEAGRIRVVYGQRLARPGGVVKNGTRITSILMEGGQRFAGKMFIDATYEGDLMALAGVKYIVGREPNAQYGETKNGIQWSERSQLAHVDPYIRLGDRTSGVLPLVDPAPPGLIGTGDKRVQAYNYRICLTDVPENRVPIERPDGYEPALYELLARDLAKRPDQTLGPSFFRLTPMPNRKTDSNNTGPISTDLVGASHDYPEADYATREKIRLRHEIYNRGYLWFLGNDPRVPEPIRNSMARWGLPKDEFTDNRNWPHQLYVREARRMISDYVMIEQNCRGSRVPTDSVGMGSYMLDSHQTSRFVDETGQLHIEGGMGIGVSPYPISYRSLVPRESECSNLLVPICLSASHVAYGSIRMEPVYMILAQSAATAASLAIDGNSSIQAVSYDRLRERLLADKQYLNPTPKNATPVTLLVPAVPDTAGVLTLAAHQATLTGPTAMLRGEGDARFVGNWRSPKVTVTWQLPALAPGTYDVEMIYACDPEHQGSTFSVQVGDKTLDGVVQTTGGSLSFRPFIIGTVTIDKTGPITVKVQSKMMKDAVVMGLRSVRLISATK